MLGAGAVRGVALLEVAKMLVGFKSLKSPISSNLLALLVVEDESSQLLLGLHPCLLSCRD